jgi:hypothetical protein
MTYKTTEVGVRKWFTAVPTRQNCSGSRSTASVQQVKQTKQAEQFQNLLNYYYG